MASTRVRYNGRTGEIFGLSLWVGFVTLVTFGMYRFWATTRVRRWFWSRITIDGERLEYSGTGFELFIAFVKIAIVLAVVLIPLKLAKNFYGLSLMAAGIISFVNALFLGLLYVFAVYYARRYRLTRTQWHGIRGNLVGSSLDYLKLNVGYLLLTLVTLGVAYPYYRIATRRYLLDHTWFGDQKFSCTARARSLIGRWLIFLVVWLAFMGVFAFQVWDLERAQKGGLSSPIKGTGAPPFAWLLFLAIPVLSCLFISYRTAEFRVLAASFTFQNVRVSSGLSAWRILLFALKLCGAAALWLMATAFLGMIAMKALTPILQASLRGFGMAAVLPGGQVSPIIFLVLMIASIPAAFLFLLGGSVLMRLYYNGVLRRAVASLSFAGELEPDRIGQTREPVPRWGEGLLEAFDFAG